MPPHTSHATGNVGIKDGFMNVYRISYATWEEEFTDSIWSSYKKASDHINRVHGGSPRYTIHEVAIDKSCESKKKEKK